MSLSKYQSILTDILRMHALPSIAVVLVSATGIEDELFVENPDTALNAIGPNSICGFGSATKMFNGALLAQAVSDGVLDYDDTLDKWAPDLGFPMDCTLEQLLCHNAGLPETPDTANTFLYPAHHCAVLRKIDIARSRSDAPFYLNLHYNLLFEVLHRVRGKTFDQQIRGLLNSVRSGEPVEPGPLLESYGIMGQRCFTLDSHIPKQAIATVGLETDLRSVAYLLSAIMGGRLVDRRTLSRWTTGKVRSTVPLEPTRPLGIQNPLHLYTPGWWKEVYGETEHLHHCGVRGGTSIDIGMVPSANLGYIVASNARMEYFGFNPAMTAGLALIQAIVTNSDSTDLMGAANGWHRRSRVRLIANKAARPEFQKISQDEMPDILGDYSSPLYGRVSTRISDGDVLIESDDQMLDGRVIISSSSGKRYAVFRDENLRPFDRLYPDVLASDQNLVINAREYIRDTAFP